MKQLIHRTVFLGLFILLGAFLPTSFSDNPNVGDCCPGTLRGKGNNDSTNEHRNIRKRVRADATEDVVVTPDSEGRIRLVFEVPVTNSLTGDSGHEIKVRFSEANATSAKVKLTGVTPASATVPVNGVDCYSYDLELIAYKWSLPVDMVVYKNSDPSQFVKYRLVSGNDIGTTGEPVADTSDLRAVRFSIPVGVTNYGRTGAYIEAHFDQFPHPGRSALKLVSSPEIVGEHAGGNLEAVATASMNAAITGTNGPGQTYNIALRANSVLVRAITVESVSANKIKLNSVYHGTSPATVHWMTWERVPGATNNIVTWTFTEGSGTGTGATTARVVTNIVTEDPSDVTKRTEDVTVTEQGTPVARRTSKFSLQGCRWELVEVNASPGNANLKNVWTYNNTAGAGSGLLDTLTLFDGGYEQHNYTLDIGASSATHVVSSPFAGTQTGLTTSSTWNKPEWDNGTTATAVHSQQKANGPNTLSSVTTTYDEVPMAPQGTIRTDVDTGLGDPITSTASFMKAGTSRLGGLLKSVTHPNNAVTVVEYASYWDGVTTTSTGDGTVSGGVTEGRRTVNRLRPEGTLYSSRTTAVGTGQGTILDDWEATAWNLGRPTTINFFPTGVTPAWTSTLVYDWWGIKSETDRYGNLSTSTFDRLKRLTSNTRLGVATSINYAGLTTTTRRGGVDIAKNVRTLDGSENQSWGPSQKTGGLVHLSTTTSTYANPANGTSALPPGIGQRTVTTAIQVDDYGGSTASQTEDRYLDGRVYESKGNLERSVRYSYLANTTGETTNKLYLFPNGNSTTEGSTTATDRAGLVYSTTGPQGTTSYDYYPWGQLKKMTDADGVKTLYGYDIYGRRNVTAIDLNDNGTIDSGTDQITQTDSYPGTYTPDGGVATGVITTETKVYATSGSNTATTVSTTHRTPDGLRSWTITPGVAHVESSATVLYGSGDWTETRVRSDRTMRESTYISGRLCTVSERDSNGSGISHTWYYYDPVTGRHYGTYDLVTGWVGTTPVSPISDAAASMADSAGTTGYTYDHRGLRTQVDAPDTTAADGSVLANITNTIYFPDGTVKETNGDQTYKTTYTYDYAARMKTMATYRTPGVADTTTWNYDPTSGRLLSKQDATLKGPSYTYTTAGRLKSRTWFRGNRARYDYVKGRLTAIRHFTNATADSGTNAGNDIHTGDIGYTYNRMGQRLRSVTSSTSEQPATSIGHNLSPSAPYQLLSETTAVDPDLTFDSATGATGVSVTEGAVLPSFQRTLTRKAANSPTNVLRPTGVVVTDGTTNDLETTIDYHATQGRVSRVTARLAGVDRIFDYEYQPSSYDRIQSVTGPATYVYTSYDPLGAISYKSNSTVIEEYGWITASEYTYGTLNPLGQRVSVQAYGSAFGYSGTTGNWQWKYNHRGELVSARNQPSQTSSPRSRFFEFDGIGNRLRHREGTYEDLTGSGITTTNYTPNNLNQYSTINPGTPLNPLHDTDGNMTAGPLPITPTVLTTGLDWDGENRLRAVGTPVGYLYDAIGRRVMKTLGGTRTYAVYDGWNLMAEYTGSVHTGGAPPGPSLERTYAWGLDLSRSAQGAGGVGGLLAVHLHTGSSSTYVPTYDGNGNISEYIDSSGGIAAHYEYDPFGNNITPPHYVGPLHDAFPFRFSTKYLDAETGLYYFGYRHYDPRLGRWLSRDPLGEAGGFNLYSYCGNDPINRHDPLGLSEYDDAAKAQFDLLLSLSGVAQQAAAKWQLHESFGPVDPFYAGNSSVEKWKSYLGQAGLPLGSTESADLVDAFAWIIAQRNAGNSADSQAASAYANSPGVKLREIGMGTLVAGLELSGVNSLSRSVAHWDLVAGEWDYAPGLAALDVGLMFVPELRAGGALARLESGAMRLERTAGRLASSDVLAKLGAIPKTGIAKYDTLAVNSRYFDRFIEGLKARGWRTKSSPFIPASNPAWLRPGNRTFYYNPNHMTFLDMMHELRHAQQLRRAGNWKIGGGLRNLYELDAYRFEQAIGTRRGFSQEYMDYLERMLGIYGN